MRPQYNRSWVLLKSFVAGVGLASTLAFTVEPHGFMHLAQARDVQHVSQPGESTQITYLIKLLYGSSQFRVRAQAAISLGMMGNSMAARDALTAALKDVHPAVRVAAATSLGRIGDASRVSALRTLAADEEGPVRNAARASIGKIESSIDIPTLKTETAVLTATTNVNRM